MAKGKLVLPTARNIALLQLRFVLIEVKKCKECTHPVKSQQNNEKLLAVDFDIDCSYVALLS